VVPESLRPFHASRITHHASRITFHVSRFTFHVSRFTFHFPCLSWLMLRPSDLGSRISDFLRISVFGPRIYRVLPPSLSPSVPESPVCGPISAFCFLLLISSVPESLSPQFVVPFQLSVFYFLLLIGVVPTSLRPFHASRITFPVSRFTFHAFRITSPISAFCFLLSALPSTWSLCP
jgi:hypothetical protein